MSRFIIVLDPNSRPQLMTDDDEMQTGCVFPTLEEAVNATKGAMWETAWVWWVVDLEEGGRVYLWGKEPT